MSLADWAAIATIVGVPIGIVGIFAFMRSVMKDRERQAADNRERDIRIQGHDKEIGEVKQDVSQIREESGLTAKLVSNIAQRFTYLKNDVEELKAEIRP